MSRTETCSTPPPAPDLATYEERADAVARQQALASLGRRAIAPPEISVLLQDAAALTAEILRTELGIAAQYRSDEQLIDTFLIRSTAGEHPGQKLIRCRPMAADPRESLCGFAVNAALPIAVSDLAAEKRFEDRVLPKHGIAAAVVAPLKLVDRAFGAIGAGAMTPRTFSEEDLLFVETVAHLLTTTIARSQAEQYLAAERRLSEGLFNTLEALVLILDRNGLVTRSNPACRKATGFSEEELLGRRLEATLAVPEELHLFHHSLGKALAGDEPVEFETHILTKHGDKRHIAWTFAAVRQGGEAVANSVIATGIDVTRERVLESQLAAAQKSAGRAVDPSAVINVERRRGMRRAYPYRQMIAPLFGNKLPDLDQFFPVMCHDISAGGFSFLIHQPLPSAGLVVGLGAPPQLSYLTAKVVHVNRVEYEGRKMFLVGCCYTGRANY